MSWRKWGHPREWICQYIICQLRMPIAHANCGLCVSFGILDSCHLFYDKKIIFTKTCDFSRSSPFKRFVFNIYRIGSEKAIQKHFFSSFIVFTDRRDCFIYWDNVAKINPLRGCRKFIFHITMYVYLIALNFGTWTLKSFNTVVYT